MIRRLLRTLALAARAFRRRAHGGALPDFQPRPDDQLVILSPGRPITDPDEAEALGLTGKFITGSPWGRHSR